MENTIFLFSCLDEKQRDLFVVLPEILICGDMRKLFDKVTRLRILDRKILSLDCKTDAPVIPPPAAHLGAQATAAAHGGAAAVHNLDHALADGGGGGKLVFQNAQRRIHIRQSLTQIDCIYFLIHSAPHLTSTTVTPASPSPKLPSR